MSFPYRQPITAALFLTAMLPQVSIAQGAIIRRNQISLGPRLEQITFADPVVDGEGTAITKLRQLSVPVGAAFGIGSSGWTLDVAAAHTSGSVEFADGSKAEISGISDVRVRASGRFLLDNLVLSIGANLPTGATSLDAKELSAVRALAAPAFGLNLPAVGFGPAGSLGLVGTRELGNWVGAAGLSYEYRGKFSPIAALQAGAEPDFDPGNATHLSLGLQRFVGEHRLSLQGGADFYSQDVLSAGGAPQTLKLGPVLTLESALALGSERIRDGRVFGALRRRATFSRNGASVDGSDGIYLNAGFDGGIPMGRAVDLHLMVDVLSQSGLDVDNTLMTAKATAAGLMLGIRARGTGGIFEPFVRLGSGSLNPGTASVGYSTLSFGATAVFRF